MKFTLHILNKNISLFIFDRFGIQAWFLLGGVLCALMVVTGLFIPTVMNMEKKGDPLPEAVGIGIKQAI